MAAHDLSEMESAVSVYCFDGATPWSRSRLRSVRRHGGVAVSVYIVGTPGGMRCASKADVTLARSMGLGVLPNWERAADFFRHATIGESRAAGVEALTACRDLGFPDDGSIDVPFSFDYQMGPGDYPSAAAKLVAANQGLGGHYRAVAYGQSGFIEYLAGHAQPGPHWLMGSTFRASSQFYPSEVGSPHVAMVQMHDASGGWLSSPVAGTDINTITQPDALGAWWPDSSPYAQGGPAMTMDKDVAAAFAAINRRLDALPASVWATKFKDPTDATGARSFPASSWLVYSNVRGKQALAAAQQAATAAKGVAVDAAAVAADISTRVRAEVGAYLTRIGGIQ